MTAKPLYEPLSARHAALLASRRALIPQIFARFASQTHLPHTSIERAQFLLDAEAIANDAIEEQEAIGVMLGDEIVRLAGFEWVSMDDEYGSEPAVAHPSRIAIIAPLSAVMNRFEDGEVPFDLHGFIQEALEIVQETDIKEREARG